MLIVGISVVQPHFIGFLSAEIKYVAHFGGFDFFQFFRLDAKLFDGRVEHFFVDGDILAAVEVDNVLTCLADGLEFMAELGERTAAREEKKARGMFGGLMSGGGGAKVQKNPPTSVGPPVVPGKPSGRETPIKEERVRLCVGISVQIRGRSVLAKAPVYGMG